LLYYIHVFPDIPLPDNWTIALDENKKMDQIKLKESDAEFNAEKDRKCKLLLIAMSTNMNISQKKWMENFGLN
jgi:hypothetical protein